MQRLLKESGIPAKSSLGALTGRLVLDMLLQMLLWMLIRRQQLVIALLKQLCLNLQISWVLTMRLCTNP